MSNLVVSHSVWQTLTTCERHGSDSSHRRVFSARTAHQQFVHVRVHSKSSVFIRSFVVVHLKLHAFVIYGFMQIYNSFSNELQLAI